MNDLMIVLIVLLAADAVMLCIFLRLRKNKEAGFREKDHSRKSSSISDPGVVSCEKSRDNITAGEGSSCENGTAEAQRNGETGGKSTNRCIGCPSAGHCPHSAGQAPEIPERFRLKK